MRLRSAPLPSCTVMVSALPTTAPVSAETPGRREPSPTAAPGLRVPRGSTPSARSSPPRCLFVSEVILFTGRERARARVRYGRRNRPVPRVAARVGPSTRARLQARVLRFEDGNFGDVKGVGRGVLEARVMFGAGYRIYFGRDGDALVLLLVGGSKASQTRDIRQAQAYWREYQGGK